MRIRIFEYPINPCNPWVTIAWRSSGSSALIRTSKKIRRGIGVQRVHQPHHDRVGLTTDIPRDHPVDDPDRKTDQCSGHADQQRNPGPKQNPVQKVASIEIGPKEMLLGRR